MDEVADDNHDEATLSTPDTLAEWRRFMAYKRKPVTLLSADERDNLSEDARDDYDERRILDVNAPMLLPTPQMLAVTKQVRIHSHMSSGYQHTARHGLAISGSQRIGKSTTAIYLAREHELRVRRRTNNFDKGTAPVLYVSTPAETSPKQLMAAFARTLGLPAPSSATTTHTLMDQVVSVIRRLGTSLIVLDEIQNLRTASASGMAAASLLKAFTERIPALFLYAGVNLPNADILQGRMAEQMQGRITVYEMQPFSVGSAEARESWERIIMQFEQEFPLTDHRVGTLATHAGWLFDVTGGVIGSLRVLLRNAQIAAIIEGDEQITITRLKATPLDFRAATELKGRSQGVPGATWWTVGAA